MANRLDVFKQAVQLTVEGDQVTLQSLKGPDGEEFHITPRKYSKKNAARIRKLMIEASTSLAPSIQAKIRRLHKEHGTDITEEILENALTDEEMAATTTVADPNQKYEIEHAKLMFGIAKQYFSDEPGPISDDIADLILESRTVADECLEAVDKLNPPFAEQTSDSSET